MTTTSQQHNSKRAFLDSMGGTCYPISGLMTIHAMSISPESITQNPSESTLRSGHSTKDGITQANGPTYTPQVIEIPASCR
jgi:hypothetical protein